MKRESPEAVVERLFDSWYVPLLRYAGRMVGQRASAEEIVQDTFLDLYKALRAGQRVQYPKAWTMCVVRRKASDRREDPFGTEHPHEMIETAETSGNWVDSLDTEIDCERVRAQMHLLTPREQEVLMLRLTSMKYREIAEALGITVNSVNTLLARALDKFQAAFGHARRPGKTRHAR